MLKSLTIQTLVNIKYPSNQNPNQWESIKFQFSEIKVEQEGPRPSQAKFNHIADQNLIKNESNSYQILLKVIKIFLNLIKNQSKFSYILYIFPDNDHIHIGMKWGLWNKMKDNKKLLNFIRDHSVAFWQVSHLDSKQRVSPPRKHFSAISVSGRSIRRIWRPRCLLRVQDPGAGWQL